MSQDSEKRKKKEIMKEIILKLHRGLTIEEAKERFLREVGNVTSTEIAEIEQALINEGLPTDEIKKFCNVHALIFQSALQQSASAEGSPAHPISLFKQENIEIKKLIESIKNARERMVSNNPRKSGDEIKELLMRLKGIEVHYTRKEQLLFPYLEKHGFFGPSTVMWGKDNDIRNLLRDSLARIDKSKSSQERSEYVKGILDPLLEEVDGMVFKEENILFPASMEKLSVDEWVEILKGSEDVGYAFIEKPKETALLIRELKTALNEEPTIDEASIFLPTGKFSPQEMMALLNTLPVDITFVDKDDTVAYFSDSKERIFVRTKAVLGRKVQNCHPPQSIKIVEKILTSFKEGKKDFYEFWIDLGGKLVHIRYFAVRSRAGEYLGTLEMTQNITPIKALEGEKRLIDEKD